MSTGYQVLVDQSRWPTARAFDDASRRRGFPLALTGLTTVQYGEPLRETPNVGGLDVLCDGQRLSLFAVLRQLNGRHFRDAETNEILEELGADHQLREGDYVFSVGLGSNRYEWRAACFVMAVLVLNFDGYGFETQTDTHGREPWAADLLRGAGEFAKELRSQSC